MDEKPTIYARRPMTSTLQPGTYYWCACGNASKQPFCDGSHAGSSFKPLAFEITEARPVALCACKHTKNPPFCDGSHRDLPTM